MMLVDESLIWAVRRSFGFDVLACPACGGRMPLVALIQEPSVIERILRHLGLPTDIPEPGPPRAPPLPAAAPLRAIDEDLPVWEPCS